MITAEILRCGEILDFIWVQPDKLLENTPVVQHNKHFAEPLRARNKQRLLLFSGLQAAVQRIQRCRNPKRLKTKPSFAPRRPPTAQTHPDQMTRSTTASRKTFFYFQSLISQSLKQSTPCRLIKNKNKVILKQSPRVSIPQSRDLLSCPGLTSSCR